MEVAHCAGLPLEAQRVVGGRVTETRESSMMNGVIVADIVVLLKAYRFRK